MPPPRPSKDLTQLWYRKLKDSGFSDIETTNDQLRQWDSFQAPRRYQQDVADYYYYAEHFLESNNWPSPTARTIWALHVQGISLRSISTRVKWNKDKVNQLIISLRQEMLPKDDPDSGSYP